MFPPHKFTQDRRLPPTRAGGCSSSPAAPTCDWGRAGVRRGVQFCLKRGRAHLVLDPSHVRQSIFSTGAQPRMADGRSPTTGTKTLLDQPLMTAID